MTATPDLRVAVFQFINKYLKGDDKSVVKDADFEKIDGKKLRVFPTDADIPKDAINHKVDEVFVARGKVELPAEGKFEEWRKGLISRLTKHPFYAFPENELLDPEVSFSAGKVGDDSFIWIYDTGRLSTPKQITEKYGFHPAWALIFKYVRPKEGPPNNLQRSCVLLGRTIDRNRLSSVSWYLEGVTKTKEMKGKKLKLGGCGNDGILAAYAALFEPSIEEVIIIDPPTSHKEGPHFLGVLRVLDIPDALGLLAPRKLTIIGGRDPAFDRTEEIYRRAGAADKLIRK